MPFTNKNRRQRRKKKPQKTESKSEPKTEPKSEFAKQWYWGLFQERTKYEIEESERTPPEGEYAGKSDREIYHLVVEKLIQKYAEDEEYMKDANAYKFDPPYIPLHKTKGSYYNTKEIKGNKWITFSWKERTNYILNMKRMSFGLNLFQKKNVNELWHIELGHYFFKPKGYDSMDSDEKTIERGASRNWSTQRGDAAKVAAFLQDMHAKGKVVIHVSPEMWYDRMNSLQKIRYLLNEKNWEDKIDVSKDETIKKFSLEEGRIFFAPAGYKYMTEEQKLSAKHNIHNWTSPGVRVDYLDRKKKHTLNYDRVEDEEWDSWDPDKKLHYRTAQQTNLDELDSHLTARLNTLIHPRAVVPQTSSRGDRRSQLQQLDLSVFI